MNKYAYEGPVMVFDILAANKWKGETIAESESKARSNLAYQFKKLAKRPAHAKVTLPGKIILIEEGVN